MKYSILCLVTFLTFSSHVWADKELDHLRRNACKANNKGQFEKVYELSQQMIQLDSAHYSGYMFEGIAFNGKENYTKAIESYNNALIRVIEVDENLYYNIGLAYYNIENYGSAIYYLRRAIELNPAELSFLIDIADAYYLLDSDSCLYYYSKVLEKRPTDSYSLRSIGEFYYNVDNYIKSIEYFDKAAPYDKKNGDIYFFRSYSKFMTDDNPGALADIKKAISLNVEEEYKYFFLGLYSLYNDQFEESVVAFNKSLQTIPDEAETYYYLAYSQNGLGLNPEALGSINKSIELEFDDPDVYRIRGYILYEMADEEGACKDWKLAADHGCKSSEDLMEEHCGNYL